MNRESTGNMPKKNEIFCELVDFVLSMGLVIKLFLPDRY